MSRSTAVIEVRSAIPKAMAVACPVCRAEIGEPCRRLDGRTVTFRGHLGAHGPRVAAGSFVKAGNA